MTDGASEPRRDRRQGPKGSPRAGRRSADSTPERGRDSSARHAQPRRGGGDRGRGRDSGGRPRGGDDRRPTRPPQDDAQRRARTPEPDLPDDVRPADLDGSARGELRTLSKENADAVARHLVVASRLIDEDPALAHEHALAAAQRAGRVAVVRESLAITAYANGDFALALRELRTYRRLSGSDDQIALIVDSERGVGRPDRALAAGREVDRASLPLTAQVGLAIAMSGARLDLGEPAEALRELERAPLDLSRVAPWSAGLFAAYAAVHDELGHPTEAAMWSARADRAIALLDEVDEESATVTVVEERLEPPADPDA